MKSVISLFILLLFVLPCYPQKEDFLGWRESRWGMSELELQKTFQSELEKLPKRETYVGAYVDNIISNYEIDGKKYTVFFQMSKETGKLKQILIKSNEIKFCFKEYVDFDGLEALFSRKYGNANYRRDDKEIYVHQRQWVFPTTTIELECSSFLTVRYFPTKSDDFKKI